MPAGSPRAITRRWVASGSDVSIAVLRLFLLGLLLVGLATGLRNQWLTVNWNKMLGDMGLPVADTEEDPIDFNRLIIGDPATPATKD